LGGTFFATDHLPSYLLAIDGAAPDLADLGLDIAVVSPSPADRIEAILAAWRERCPIYLALLKPNTIALTTSAGAAAARLCP
jgi:hypothetical protein